MPRGRTGAWRQEVGPVGFDHLKIVLGGPRTHDRVGKEGVDIVGDVEKIGVSHKLLSVPPRALKGLQELLPGFKGFNLTGDDLCVRFPLPFLSVMLSMRR